MTTIKPTPVLTKEERRDLKVLATFTAIYCHTHHTGSKEPAVEVLETIPDLAPKCSLLCSDCCNFLVYAIARRLKCPLDPKPSCKHCPVHCYRPGHREQVRAIMRFSGRHLLLRGRLDLLWHYFF